MVWLSVLQSCVVTLGGIRRVNTSCLSVAYKLHFISMEASPKELILYVTTEGREPFTEWLSSLPDLKARAKIRVRLDRVSLGNFGDCHGVGDGIQELRINYGPGYRVCFAQEGTMIVLLLCRGDKSSQTKDIETAKQYWTDYRRRP